MSHNSEKRITTRSTLEPMHRSVDLEGRIIDCNDKYARMLGYVKDEVIGMSIFDHTPEDKHEVLRTIFENWKMFRFLKWSVRHQKPCAQSPVGVAVFCRSNCRPANGQPYVI